MNFVISRCDAVRINGVQVSAPGDSPNTDGIHISESTNVVLQNSKIGTGSCLAEKFVRVPHNFHFTGLRKQKRKIEL